MRRTTRLTAAAFALALAAAPGLAPTDAWARAGDGMSMGSRGARTYSAPPSTSTAPYSAAPMQRSITPRSEPAPGYGAPAPGYAPGYGQPAFGGRSPFTSGLLGGLIGAGIGGLLFGHGMFGGINGIGSFFGFLLQIFLLVLLVRWLFRMFARGGRPAFAGMGGFARTMNPGAAAARGGMAGGGTGPAAPPVQVSRADYQAFEGVLKGIQAGWSAHDLNAISTLATPEMASYFAEQLAEQASRGVRNFVTDVRLEQGDLAEAWSEGPREYATVAMRFSMLDYTKDAMGRIVAGSDTARTMATELWTFMRTPGGRWILSAVQQTR